MTVSTYGLRTPGMAPTPPRHELCPPILPRPAGPRPAPYGTRPAAYGPRPAQQDTAPQWRPGPLRGLGRRMAAVASAVAAALLVVLLAASPAHAAGEVRVTIDDLTGSLQAGEVDDFRVTFSNESRESISGVFTMIAVALPEAPPDSLSVQRDGVDLPYQVTGDGTVIFTDATAFDLSRSGGNARRRIDFTIYFRDHAPSGQAVVTVGAYARGELLGSASVTVDIRGVVTTPPNTDPGVVPTFEAGPSYSIAPLPETAAAVPPNSTVPTIVYVLAGLLVFTGVVTLILTFWAPGRHFAEAYGPGPAGDRRSDGRRPMAWPTRAPASARVPRPPYPTEPGPYPTEPGRGGPLGETARAWPAVSRPGSPTAYPRPASGAVPPSREPGPATGYGRAVTDPGPTTGYGRAVTDPGPATGYGRAVTDPGPTTGTGRAIRDPRAAGGRPPRDADDRWRYD